MGSMKGTTRSRLITTFALSGAFIVMMAALVYNPGPKTDSIAVLVSGKVTDENGTPLSNVIIRFGGIGQTVDDLMNSGKLSVNSDDRGQYSAELTGDNFSLPGKVLCVAWVSDGSHWSQAKNITINSQSKINLDFVLVNSTRLILPIGPVVMASTLPGLTQVKISTYLVSSNPPQSMYGFENTVNEKEFTYVSNSENSANISFNNTSDHGSLTIHGLGGNFTGVYNDTPEGIGDLESWFTPDFTFFNHQPKGIYYFSNETLSKDYLDPENVTSQSTFYNLTLGENVTITDSPKQNVTLPEALLPKVNVNLLGLKLNISINGTYRFTPDFNASASVTITPLTPGTHVYQVYIEQDYIIHVWELTNDA